MGREIGKATASGVEAVGKGNARRDGRPTVAAAETVIPDAEVVAKPTRRRFTAEYKLQILREAESQRPLVTAVVTGAFAFEDGRPARVPESFREKLSALLVPDESVAQSQR